MVILMESQDCRRGLREEQKFCDKNLGATSILQELSVMSWLGAFPKAGLIDSCTMALAHFASRK